MNIRDFKIKIAQIKLRSSDLYNNYEKIVNITKESINENVDILVFPETAISGYLCGENWDKEHFIIQQENYLKNISNLVPEDMLVVIGYVSYHGKRKSGKLRLKNSVAVINQGKIQVYDKQLLANGEHHEDRKYFEEGSETKVFDVKIKNKNIKIGTPICEDFWYNDHNRNIPKEMFEMGAEILITVNQSYFYYNKMNKRINIYSNFVNKYKIPIISVNSVGIGDVVKNIFTFDGGSTIWDENGLVYQFEQFEEIVKIVNIRNNIKPITLSKMDEILNNLIFQTREYFDILGNPKAEVMLSGGIDSAIVLYLMVKALGKENVICITHPTSYNSKSLKRTYKIAENVDVKIYTEPIDKICYQIFETDDNSFNDNLIHTKKVLQSTIQATLRSTLALKNAHRFGAVIVPTGNHTEIVLGWANFHDVGSIGLFMPLGDLTKIECFQLSQYINEINNSEIIPSELYDGREKPAAELPDAMEDPIDYFAQSGLCALFIRNNLSKSEVINMFINKQLPEDYFPLIMYNNFKSVYDTYTLDQFIKEIEFTLSKKRISVFKAAQSAPISCLSPRSRGFSNRETLINLYNEK